MKNESITILRFSKTVSAVDASFQDQNNINHCCRRFILKETVLSVCCGEEKKNAVADDSHSLSAAQSQQESLFPKR